MTYRATLPKSGAWEMDALKGCRLGVLHLLDAGQDKKVQAIGLGGAFHIFGKGTCAQRREFLGIPLCRICSLWAFALLDSGSVFQKRTQLFRQPGR